MEGTASVSCLYPSGYYASGWEWTGNLQLPVSRVIAGRIAHGKATDDDDDDDKQ